MNDEHNLWLYSQAIESIPPQFCQTNYSGVYNDLNIAVQTEKSKRQLLIALISVYELSVLRSMQTSTRVNCLDFMWYIVHL